MTAYDYQAKSSVMVQAVSFVALMYMSMCTYWPLFRINVGWSYNLQETYIKLISSPLPS